MQGGTGKFEFCHDGQVAVTGNVGSLTENKAYPVLGSLEQDNNTWLPLNADEIYKEFRLRGYNYSGLFQGIRRIHNEGKWADLAWTGNWMTFLDTMLKTTILSTTSRNMALPIDFERIAIDPIVFLKHLKKESVVGNEGKLESCNNKFFRSCEAELF